MADRISRGVLPHDPQSAPEYTRILKYKSAPGDDYISAEQAGNVAWHVPTVALTNSTVQDVQEIFSNIARAAKLPDVQVQAAYTRGVSRNVLAGGLDMVHYNDDGTLTRGTFKYYDANQRGVALWQLANAGGADFAKLNTFFATYPPLPDALVRYVGVSLQPKNGVDTTGTGGYVASDEVPIARTGHVTVYFQSEPEATPSEMCLTIATDASTNGPMNNQWWASTADMRRFSSRFAPVSMTSANVLRRRFVDTVLNGDVQSNMKLYAQFLAEFPALYPVAAAVTRPPATPMDSADVILTLVA